MDSSGATFERRHREGLSLLRIDGGAPSLEYAECALNEAMLGKITLAPIAKPEKILDVGCGTGIQTRLLAEMYPSAQVIGVDPNPVPEANNMPKNATFILGCIEDLLGKHELLQPSTFDLIYQRYLLIVIKGWSEHITQIQALLKPGGWVEFQESVFSETYDEHEQLLSAGWKYPEIMRRDATERGLEFDVGLKLPDMCRKAGFVEARSTWFYRAYRPGWVARPETEKMATYTQWSMLRVVGPLLARGARPKDGEDVEALIREFKENTVEGPIGRHHRFYVVVARRAAE